MEEVVLAAVNKVKSRNKLVGDLANNDLYDSDDGIDNNAEN